LITFSNYFEDFEFNYITLKIISQSSAGANPKFFLGTGTRSGIVKGNVITNNDGVIGVISDVTDNYSIVRCIKDINSRIPAQGVTSGIKFIVKGKGPFDDSLEINALSQNADFTDGELVITTGDGNLYPGGLVIGHIALDPKRGASVRTSVNWKNLDFVRVLLKEKLS
jgi:rod shape-determining protein MreC